MAKESIRQQNALKLIDRLDKEISGDTHYLSRGDLDTLYYRLQDFKRLLMDTYDKRLGNLRGDSDNG